MQRLHVDVMVTKGTDRHYIDEKIILAAAMDSLRRKSTLKLGRARCQEKNAEVGSSVRR
jgi:hypothetical protein